MIASTVIRFWVIASIIFIMFAGRGVPYAMGASMAPAVAIQTGYSGPPQSFAAASRQSRKIELPFSSDGIKYNYVLYVPASTEKSAGSPLLIVLHGLDSKVQRFIHSTGLIEIADQSGTIIAYPQIQSTDQWGGFIATSDHRSSAMFIRSLIKQIEGQQNIDRNKIFLSGFSTGGILVLGAMCDLYDEIAAFAVVSATLASQQLSGCKVKKPVPALIIAGRDDPVIPWDVGDTADNLSNNLQVKPLSVSETVDFWRLINGCNARPQMDAMANTDLSDGTTVTRLAYDFRCLSNAPVLLYAITGGGHSWPGSRYRLLSFRGRVSQDYSAAKIIWQFFANESFLR